MTHGPLTATLASHLARLDLAEDHPATAILARLEAPVRVAVAGRIKSGKSTLVNALLHQRVAPTDVGECTKLVAWFRHGVTEEVVAHTIDGRAIPLGFTDDGAIPADPGVPISEVDRLEVRLSLEVLRTLELIDTPGLASATDDAEDGTRDVLGLDARSRHAARRADALLLVAPARAAQDEARLAAEFDRRFGSLTGSALNAVGVVTRLDEVAGNDATDSASDVLTAAAASVAAVRAALGTSVADVVPTVGLWAETATCGLLREHDVRALAAMREVVDDLSALRTARHVLEAGDDAGREARARLLDLLGLAGVRRVLAAPPAVMASAAPLRDELAAWSGVAGLEAAVRTRFAARADAVRSSWAIGALEAALADGGDPRLRDVIEQVELDPRFAAVELARALQELDDDTPIADRWAELRALVTGEPGPDGEPGDPTEGAARWRDRAADPLAGSTARRVAQAAARCHEARFELDQQLPSDTHL